MIDVCVVTYENGGTIAKCIQSVRTHIPGATVRIWDNSPSESTIRVVKGSQAESICILQHSSENIGFGEACNQLAAESSADWLVFLNPDADVTDLRLDLEDLPHDVIVGAVVHGVDGRIQRTFGPERTIASEIAVRLLRYLPAPRIEPVMFRSAYVSGAAFAVRRTVFVELGGFDSSQFFMYYEDIDFCRRARAAGRRVMVSPSWHVRHVGGHSAKKSHETALERSFVSAFNYHRRWSRARWLFRPVCIVEAGAKMVLITILGRAGQTSRSAQWHHLRWLVRGTRS